MLLAIPYQLLEPQNVVLENFHADYKHRIIAPLIYKAVAVQFNDIPILTPVLTVGEYNPTTNRIRFDIKGCPAFAAKIQLFQDSVIQRFYQKRFDIFKMDVTAEEIKSTFQLLYHGTMLTLFIFPTSQLKMADGSTKIAGQLKTGDKIRCVIRIHGVSMLPVRPTDFFPRFRIQHSVPMVYGIT